MSENRKFFSFFKKKSKKKITKSFWIGFVLAIMIVVVTAISISLIVIKVSSNRENKSASEAMDSARSFLEHDIIGSEGTLTEVESHPDLNAIIPTWNLQSLEYNYNSFCTVRIDHENRYHVSYEGVVTLGIDTREIDYDVDDENMIVHIYLPDISVIDRTVDPNSLRYIFIDEAYNNSETGAYALIDCTEDLEDKTSEDNLMFDLARENCQNGVEGLMTPLMEYSFPGYELVIEFRDGSGEA